MNWRIGLALVFLLVLLFSVLHMAYSTMPARHEPPPRVDLEPPARGPVSPEYGHVEYGDGNERNNVGHDSGQRFRDGNERNNVGHDSGQRFATMNNYRPMEDTFKRVSPAFKFNMDSSGNIVYPL